MPRNDSAGGVSADRVQPGRIMLVLREAVVDDQIVYNIAAQYGEVKNVHRPPNNRLLVFVQYEHPSSAELAIPMLKRLPIFKNVDPAIKSERFNSDKSGGGGNNNNNADDQPQKNMKYQQYNKGGANLQQKQQRGANNSNSNNHYNQNGQGARNDDMNDVSYSSMESGSPQMQMQPDPYQPKFSLGCWLCNKLPNFECRCGAFYCGPECQRTDWPKHKDICMPRLVPISYSNKCILQEAAAAKQAVALPNALFSLDQQSQMQQFQQNRRGQTNIKNNINNPKQMNQQKNVNKPQQQQKEKPETTPPTPKSSTVESPAANEKLSGVIGKLQRLKIAKSVVGSTPVTKGVLLPGVFPLEGSMVKITASLASGVLYVYHNNGKEGGQHSDYYLLTNRMFQAAANAKPLAEIPSVDDVIFAPYIGGFYRAKVISVDGENLEVFFVDFGNSDTVEWKQSREIVDRDLKWAKYLTFPVTVEGVDSFSAEMIKLLETLEHVQEFELTKAAPDQGMISVVLKRPKQSQTLNMELIELSERELRLREERQKQKQREAQLEQEKNLKLEQEQKLQQEERKKEKVDGNVANPINYKPVLFDESMDTKQLPMGGPKKLLIADASEVLETRIISVVSFDELEKYAAVLDHCNLVGAADSNAYAPTDEGEVCLVHYEDYWCRALYDISDGSFMLLDVGIITEIPAANVRRFPPGLSHVVYNNEVFVDNLPKLKELMQDGKPESVHGMLVTAKIAASEEGVSITIIDKILIN